MSKDKKEKKEKEESKIFYLRASSIEDVCRHACRFDFNADPLLFSENKLIAVGERIGETLIAYYAITKDSKNIIRYEPASGNGKERAEFVDRTDLSNKYYINVVRADFGKMPVAKGIEKKAVQIVKIGNPIDLVSAVIRKAAKDESIANIYSFNSGGKRILAAFDVLEALSNDKPLFYFCSNESKSGGNFARYDYRNNTLDFTNAAGDHAYMYAKIINLAEPFPFFNQ